MNINHPTASQTAALRALWQEAFQDPDAFLDSFFTCAYAPERCLCMEQDDHIAAAAYWFDCETDGGRAAYIYAVATTRRCRHRGLCHTLMAEIHRLLASAGYCGSLLVPGNAALETLYASMGYEHFGGIREVSCAAGDAPVPLRAVDAGEYARLRRGFLPGGGVVQEGENLAFLSCHAGLYAGDDFLLAASREKNRLWGAELLGNTGAAPGILRALGADTGVFRTPGSTPFAMYRPLTAAPAPTYFGFAFD